MKGQIYKITNLINNKIYIGKTIKNINNPKYLGSGTVIKKAVSKYGVEAFTKEIIEECEESVLNEREKYWIEYFNTLDSSIGYNIAIGGEGGNLGEIVNDIIRKNIPRGVDHHLYGKVNIYRKGKPSWNKGKQGVYSEETLQKMKGPKSEEHKKNLSLSKKNKPLSQKHKDSLSKVSKRGDNNRAITLMVYLDNGHELSFSCITDFIEQFNLSWYKYNQLLLGKKTYLNIKKIKTWVN